MLYFYRYIAAYLLFICSVSREAVCDKFWMSVDLILYTCIGKWYSGYHVANPHMDRDWYYSMFESI